MNLTNSRHTLQENSSMCLAVSACLVGQKVRYDGGHKQHAFVCNLIDEGVEVWPICPEVEIGLGVPRPAIHIVERGGKLKALGVDQPTLDVTIKLNRLGCDVAKRLGDVDGYIFKARSPSCGVSSTQHKMMDGRTQRGPGLFAAQIMRQRPLMPLIEETSLENTAKQVNYLQQVEAYRRWREFNALGMEQTSLREFHQRNRLSLMAHGGKGLRQIEHWFEALPQSDRITQAQLDEYGGLFMRQFKNKATHRRHVIVLRHLCSRLRKQLDRVQQQEFARLVEAFDEKRVTRLQVISELGLMSQRASIEWLAQQNYLQSTFSLQMEK